MSEKGLQHFVCVSGGKDSTAMALRLVELHPDAGYRFICTPTGNELPDVIDHWDRLGELLGRPIERISHPLGLGGLIEKQQMLPSHAARWCTRLLKIQPALRFYAENAPCIAYVGLRFDEPTRVGIFGDKVPQKFPLKEWGWKLSDVISYLSMRGITVPARTDCAWCYDQSLADWWELLLRYPAIFRQGEEMEQRYGHSFRSPDRDTWPVRLTELRECFERGDIPNRVDLNGDLFADEPVRCRTCLL